MTDANAKTPTDAEIVALAYDCSALPETCTDATLLVFARAVLAKWGAQPVAAPVGPFPVASKSHGAWDGIEDVLAMPDGTDIYTASQVQAMLTAVPRNATLYSPDDVAFPAQRSADGTDALPPELSSIAKQASTAAAKKGGRHGTD